MKKIKDLKVGDAVVVYQEYSERYTPNQREVAKIGRTKIHVKFIVLLIDLLNSANLELVEYLDYKLKLDIIYIAPLCFCKQRQNNRTEHGEYLLIGVNKRIG